MSGVSYKNDSKLWIGDLNSGLANGPLDYYEISIISLSKSITYKVPGNGCYLDLDELSISFRVVLQAVNIIENLAENVTQYREAKIVYQSKSNKLECRKVDEDMTELLKHTANYYVAKSQEFEVFYISVKSTQIVITTLFFVGIIFGLIIFGLYTYRKLDLYADFELFDL